MSCRHDLANSTCRRCYPSTGTIEPGPEEKYEPNLEGPGAVPRESYLRSRRTAQRVLAAVDETHRQRESRSAPASRESTSSVVKKAEVVWSAAGHWRLKVELASGRSHVLEFPAGSREAEREARQLASLLLADPVREEDDSAKFCRALHELGSEVEGGQKFYIWDKRSRAGDEALFWRPAGNGYTASVEEAGLFAAEEARTGRDTDVAVPRELVSSISRRTVSRDRLQAALALRDRGEGKSTR